MKKRKITIGRSTSCDIVLADITVSRVHAEIELLENKQLLLTDCLSSMGTFLIRGGREEKVKQQTISKHDQLKFGNIKIPVSEILSATKLCEQDEPVVKYQDPIQRHNISDNINHEPQPECSTHKTESFFDLFFSFEGRISRSTYWLKYMLPYTLVYFVLAILDINTGSFDYSTGYGTYTAIFTLLGVIPSLAIGIKRCHDRNRTGWFLLVSLIPLFNIWMLIELWFLKGTSGNNKYGPDPLL